MSLKMTLVLVRPPVVLKPVDEHLEGSVVRLVEKEAFRAHLNKLFADFLFRHVAKYDVLWVGWKDCKSIRNPTRLLLLLFLKSSF